MDGVSEANGDSMLTATLFIVPIEGDRDLIYAPLRRTAFVADRGMAAVLAELAGGRRPDQPGTLEFLEQIGFLGGGAEAPPEAPCEGAPRHSAITLLLTTACNLRCRYCYASAGETAYERMTAELARGGIDYVAGSVQLRGENEMEVSYHGGGEPTLNWDVLVDSWTYAERRAEECGLALTGGIATNGVIDAWQADWIAGHLSCATLSVDGLPAIQDHQRPTAGGTGSSGRVMQTAGRFDGRGFDYSIRMTVTEESVASLPDSVAFLCERTGARGFQAEPVYAMGRGVRETGAETEAFIGAFVAARRIAEWHGRRLTFSAARTGTRTRCFCGASRDNFVLLPSGGVTACHEAYSESAPYAAAFLYGRSMNGFEFDQAVLERLRETEVERKSYCAGCFARWDCAGDCHYKWLHSSRGGPFAGSPRCAITRALIVDELLGRIAASGGWLWQEQTA